jgi:mannose-1-phosphate guanylyltransferase
MVPIGDVPAVAHVANGLRRAGFEQLVVNVFHRPGDVRAWARAEGIAVSEEEELLGTAGGVERARALLGEGDVLVWNGDILSELDPSALTGAHARADASATLAVVARPAGQGNVGIDDRGRIVRLRSRSFGAEASGGDFIGVHVIGSELRAALPLRGCLVGDVYIPALERGVALGAHVTTAPFVDVGTVAAYVAANLAWLGPRASWVAPDATVRASVDGSIIGRGARVDADAIRSIVWANARVTERVEDAIVTPYGIVPT